MDPTYVVPRLQYDDQRMQQLLISNEGKTPARNITLSLDREILGIGDPAMPINALPWFSETVATMSPGDKFFFTLWSGYDKPGTKDIPKEFTILASYETLGKRVREETHLHVQLSQGQTFPPRTTQHYLREISQRVESLTKSLDTLRREPEITPRG